MSRVYDFRYQARIINVTLAERERIIRGFEVDFEEQFPDPQMRGEVLTEVYSEYGVNGDLIIGWDWDRIPVTEETFFRGIEVSPSFGLPAPIQYIQGFLRECRPEETVVLKWEEDCFHVGEPQRGNIVISAHSTQPTFENIPWEETWQKLVWERTESLKPAPEPEPVFDYVDIIKDDEVGI